MSFRYLSLNAAWQQRFGRKVYKLALPGGTTCPNRDGTKGEGGCIFCSCGGAGEFAAGGKTVSEQIALAKARIASKLPPDAGFVPYFQSFTATYGDVNAMRSRFFEALYQPDSVAVSVATRPDCLPEDVLALLAEMARVKPLFVELGLQTANEDTARAINRCYDNACFEGAVRALRAVGAEVVVHLIFGLPGESEQDMLSSVDYACRQDIQGIKLQLLHVLKDAPLSQMPYTPLEKEAYFHVVGEALKRIPPHIVVHRLTGDGDKKTLLAPLWSADKHAVRNGLEQYLCRQDIMQGRKEEKNGPYTGI